MTPVLWHDLPLRAADLSADLLEVIAGMPPQARSGLVERATLQPRAIPTLVLTGQYSSGKSTLIKALTDGRAQIATGSDITTDVVEEYDWDGAVTLVDTPGVQAGVVVHDERAEAAIEAADLLLFVVTVDLFDDALARHFTHVADDLGKRDQILVVITKSASMSAAPGVRSAAVAAAATGGRVPDHVETDALEYLRALDRADPERAARGQRSSGIPALREAINRLAGQRGDLAMLRQPFQQIKATALDAQSRLTADPDEAAALALLARQRRALSARRDRIAEQVSGTVEDFRDSSQAAAETFADTIETLDETPDTGEGDRAGDVDAALRRLREDLDTAAQRFAEHATNVIRRQFDDLASEAREIEASPHTRLMLDLAAASDAQITNPRISMQATPRAGRQQQGPRTVPPWAGDLGDWLKSFDSFWGAGGGARASAGSPGHKIVLDLGHRFGKKFKPWEAVNVANRIGQAARVASVGIPVVVAVAGVAVEERARVKAERARAHRRAALVREVVRQADLIADDVQRQVNDALDPVFAAGFKSIDAVHREITATQTNRDALHLALQGVQAGCDDCLALIANHTKPE